MYSTSKAAEQLGVCKNTLLRWISERLISDVDRDWRGWRVWSEEDIERVKGFRKTYHERPASRVRRRSRPRAGYAASVAESMAEYGAAWKEGVRNAS